MSPPILNFAQSPVGTLYISDGFRKVRTWDGMSSASAQAGIDAPTGLRGSSAGNGLISGIIYVGARFLDATNQPSNIDIASDAISIAGGSGAVTSASNQSPIIVKTQSPHGLPDTTGMAAASWPQVQISGVQGNTAANGVWLVYTGATLTWAAGSVAIPQDGLHFALVSTAAASSVYDSVTLASQLLSVGNGLGSAGSWQQGAGSISYSIDAPIDSRAAQIQWLRTKSGDASVFYVDGTTTCSATAQSAYSAGQVAVTTGQTLVQGISASWTDDLGLVGRIITIGGFAYYIVSADIVNQRLEIAVSYIGNTGTFSYVIGATSSGGGSSFTSSNTDAQLGIEVPLEDANGNDLAINRFGEPPDDKMFLAQYSGRFLAFGYPVWTQGKVALGGSSEFFPSGYGGATGPTTVACQNCGLTSDMQLAGRTILFQGSTTAHTIQSFSATDQTITLTGSYSETANISTGYAILPDTGSGRRTFDWSDATYPSGWNPLDSVGVPEDQWAGNSVGAAVLDRILYLLGEYRCWRVAFQQSPTVDGAQFLGPQRGVLNTRTSIIVEGILYCMDRQGIYALASGQVQTISTPIHDLFDPQRPTAQKINFRWAQNFHVAHDPEHETIRWFVSMCGRYPRHCLCYQYRFNRWWVEEFGFDIGSSTMGRVAGRFLVFLGAEGHNIFAMETGFLDCGVSAAYTIRASVTTAGPTWITAQGASFDTSWPANCVSVDIVSGRGIGQRRRIVDVATGKLYVDQPWLVMPDASSVFQVGGIRWKYKSGSYRWASGESQPSGNADSFVRRKIELLFQPTVNESLVTANVFYDQNTEPESWGYSRAPAGFNDVEVDANSPDLLINTQEALGRVQLFISGGRETRAGGHAYVNVGLSGVTNGERHRIYQLSIYGAEG